MAKSRNVRFLKQKLPRELSIAQKSDILPQNTQDQMTVVLEQSVAPDIIELYRRDDMIEVSRTEWHVAVSIFQEGGWSPIRPIGTYLCPLGFVPQDEGKAMQRAGRSLFSKIKSEPALSVAVPMDLGLLYRLTEFVGGGAFIVGRHGAYANAKANDFSDSGE